MKIYELVQSRFKNCSSMNSNSLKEKLSRFLVKIN